LDQEAKILFRAHAFFGQKQLTDSQDRFPHLNFHITQCSDMMQLEFIMNYLRNSHSYNANNKPEQFSLFE
jgi:hypothetical protein